MNEPNAGPDALRHRWRPGNVTLGGWCHVGNSFSAELMGRSGFDWVCVDQQHGIVGPDVLVPMVQALSLTRTPVFVRVPWNEPASIMRALDAGAQGLIIPLVNSAADAAAAVSAARYPPLGDRSWGPVRPLHEMEGYSPQIGNRRVIVAVQIETVRAIAELDAILSVEGVDAAFVGPADLSLSAGWEPTLTPRRPEQVDLIMQVLRSAHAHGMPAGIYCGSVEMTARWRDAGFEMLAVFSDSIILKTGAVGALEQLREGVAAAKPAGPTY